MLPFVNTNVERGDTIAGINLLGVAEVNNRFLQPALGLESVCQIVLRHVVPLIDLKRLGPQPDAVMPVTDLPISKRHKADEHHSARDSECSVRKLPFLRPLG